MLTHSDLGIKPKQFDALIETRDLLRSGALDHYEEDPTERDDAIDLEDESGGEERRPLFNMLETAEVYDCGSICCIGGTMALIEKGVSLAGGVAVLTPEVVAYADMFVRNYFEQAHRAGGPNMRSKAGKMAALFYPNPVDDDVWHKITPSMAADAIDNLLEHGDPRWSEIAKAEGLPLASR